MSSNSVNPPGTFCIPGNLIVEGDIHVKKVFGPSYHDHSQCIQFLTDSSSNSNSNSGSSNMINQNVTQNTIKTNSIIYPKNSSISSNQIIASIDVPTNQTYTFGMSQKPLWVAVGQDNGLVTSPDGITWTPVSPSPFGSGTGYDVAWNGLLWVAVGNYGSIVTSDDGKTWIPRTSQFDLGVVRGVAWNGSMWVAVGQGAGTAGGVSIVTSTDGETWAPSSGLPFREGSGYGVAWNGSMWVAVGSNDGIGSGNVSIVTSTDGETWAPSSGLPFGEGIGRSVAWNGSMWVAVGYGTASVGAVSIVTSTDGRNWTPVSPSPFGSGTGWGVAWNGSMWVAVGQARNNNGSDTGVSIVTSYDGITWTPVSSSAFGTGYGYGVAWNGSMWVAVGHDISDDEISLVRVSMVTSYDGITWTPISSSPFGSGIGYGIAYNHMRANSITFKKNTTSTVGIITGPITTTPLQTSSTNNKLEFVSDRYFNRGYNNVSVCVESSLI